MTLQVHTSQPFPLTHPDNSEPMTLLPTGVIERARRTPIAGAEDGVG
jgi:hypothetical protein